MICFAIIQMCNFWKAATLCGLHYHTNTTGALLNSTLTYMYMYVANRLLFAMPQIHLLKHYQFIYGMIDYSGTPL